MCIRDSASGRAAACARPEALGFLQVDGHVRVYAGTRDLPKTHIARMHLAGHATAETWVADADADPVLVVTAPPAASLASELVRLLPELRGLLGPDRRATVLFDRGGWSPTTFAAIRAAGFDLLTYRKGAFDRLAETAFTAHSYTDPDGQLHSYRLVFPQAGRMGHCRPYAHRARHGRFGYGYRQPQAAGGSDLPFRPRSAVHLRRFRSVLQEEWYQTFPGQDRYLLRQCRIGIDLRDLQERADPHSTVANNGRSQQGDRRLDQELLQHKTTPLHARILDTNRIRTRI